MRKMLIITFCVLILSANLALADRTCQRDEDCMEVYCLSEGFAHEKCSGGVCVMPENACGLNNPIKGNLANIAIVSANVIVRENVAIDIISGTNLTTKRIITIECGKGKNRADCTKQIKKEIEIERKGNRTALKSGNVSVEISGETDSDGSSTIVKMNNVTREIKIMPDTASSIALARLGIKVCSEINNCTIELKDVGIRNGTANATRLKYVIHAIKERHFLFWKWNKTVETTVDAETGVTN